MKPRYLAAIPLALLTCCVAPVAPPPPAPPTPAPPPAPPPIGDWKDAPLTPGAWTYAADAQGSHSRFGRPGAEAELILRCDRAARTVDISRAGALAGQMLLSATAGERGLDAKPMPGQPTRIGAALVAADPFLDLLAFSRGRFAVTTPGLPRLIVPAWPEVARVIEDCRG